MIEIRHKETGEILHQVRGATLEGARLRHRVLVRADLRGANLQRADLLHVDLTEADLEGARLIGIRGAGPPNQIRTLGWLGSSLLIFSIYEGMMTLAASESTQWIFTSPPGIPLLFSLAGVVVCIFHALAGLLRPAGPVKLSGAILRGANLTDANLHESDLERADLRGATIRSARLGRALLRRALLQHADLQSARLDGADLREADLRSARLPQASLRGADLRGADLRGADLRAQLYGVKLKGARYDETTRWPASFQPARHGAVTAAEVVPAPLPQGRGDEPSPSSENALPSEPAGSAPPAK